MCNTNYMFKTCCLHIRKRNRKYWKNGQQWKYVIKIDTYIDCGQMAGISSRPPFLTNVITSLF